MPTSNKRIILTDVDGVLLEWEHHFTKWMLQRTLFDERGARYHPHRLLPDKQNTYEMAERFGVTKDEIRKHIREFNSSAWMGTQRPMLGITDMGKTVSGRGVDIHTNNISDIRHTSTTIT